MQLSRMLALKAPPFPADLPLTREAFDSNGTNPILGHRPTTFMKCYCMFRASGGMLATPIKEPRRPARLECIGLVLSPDDAPAGGASGFGSLFFSGRGFTIARLSRP